MSVEHQSPYKFSPLSVSISLCRIFHPIWWNLGLFRGKCPIFAEGVIVPFDVKCIRAARRRNHNGKTSKCCVIFHGAMLHDMVSNIGTNGN